MSLCGSGRAREESSAVHGTGSAGVRGHARSHKDLAIFKICTRQCLDSYALPCADMDYCRISNNQLRQFVFFSYNFRYILPA